MNVPSMQSISGNNDGTYTSYMVPLVTGMLGLPCRPCWGPRQLIAGDYLLISSCDSGGPGDGTFVSLALPHLVNTGIFALYLSENWSGALFPHLERLLKVSGTCLTIHYNFTTNW